MWLLPQVTHDGLLWSRLTEPRGTNQMLLGTENWGGAGGVPKSSSSQVQVYSLIIP